MQLIRARLDFKRIQTFLFASPRMRAMLGANAALGRVIRVELAQLAQDHGARAADWLVERLPGEDPKDPLALIDLPHLGLVRDDPRSLYRETGVLVRDGGHFIATFPDESKARAFLQSAMAIIQENLPGLRAEAYIENEPLDAHGLGALETEALFQHPAFQVSHWLGNRPADRETHDAFVSAEEGLLEELGRSFRQNPQDLIGALEASGSIPCAQNPPESLVDLADGVRRRGYIALIHADGNGIGNRYSQWREAGRSGSPLEQEVHGERFFHSMRVAVRKALVEALKAVFSTAPSSYQLLMLGGDDLLLVCSAGRAFAFVEAYARALRQYPLADNAPLDVGVGVAIAKASFPFHRLHAAAEALADSAKRRYRADHNIGSVVDWHVTTNAWLEDPISERRMESLSAGLILSAKPYPIFDRIDEKPEMGLEGLMRLVRCLQEEYRKSDQGASSLARSQLRALVETLREGRSLAELAWLELPKEMRKFLEDAGMAPFKNPMPPIIRVPDIVELFEWVEPITETQA